MAPRRATTILLANLSSPRTATRTYLYCSSSAPRQHLACRYCSVRAHGDPTTRRDIFIRVCTYVAPKCFTLKRYQYAYLLSRVKYTIHLAYEVRVHVLPPGWMKNDDGAAIAPLLVYSGGYYNIETPFISSVPRLRPVGSVESGCGC